ncbi:hypothetical protein VTJ49DRAFT_3924 [Mycothermus thermophilus]|uniref:Lipid droplet-associated hydrolase n=1 Tax=Humicola insolens TaxID=85995 RepID=A0ABR3V6Z5_HUMIN
MGTKTAKLRPSHVPALEFPSRFGDDKARKQCLIVMIPGNPGLVAYYEPFLATLRHLLDEKESQPGCRHAFHIHGRNLLGFADEDHEPAFGTLTDGPEGPAAAEPFNLEDQIRGVCEHLCRLNQPAPPGGSDGNDVHHGDRTRPFDEIILMGHSVGAYITVEVFHRHYLARKAQQNRQQLPPSHDALTTLPLKSAILLFPTLTHIARSPRGQVMTFLANHISPYNLNRLVTRPAADLLLFLLDLPFWPAWLRAGIVRRLTGGFPEHAAAATEQFLRQRDAIWQALHMGADEMRKIGEERWEEGMWEGEGDLREVVGEEEKEEENGNVGAAGADDADKKAKFFLFFAEKDHWVADEARAEFVERRRNHEKGRTRVVVDEAGLPHAFCIHHSETVAEKVHAWIQEIAGL